MLTSDRWKTKFRGQLIFMNLLPVFVTLLASLLLGEPLHGYHLAGGAIALAGVWLGQVARRPLLRRNATPPRDTAPGRS